MSVPQQLMDILACPRCKGPVALSADAESIECRACALRYPVRDDIPVMLVDEARPL